MQSSEKVLKNTIKNACKTWKFDQQLKFWIKSLLITKLLLLVAKGGSQ